MSQFKLGVVLNGPPGCGKDTIANIIAARFGFRKHQYKDALYAETAKYFEVDLDKLIHFATDRSLKDSKSLAGLGGRTPREALIYVSESVFKPRFGNDYFGKVEVNRLEELLGNMDSDVNVIYPDGGFEAEVVCSQSFFSHVVVIRLHRNSFDFSGDSRNYLYPNSTDKCSSVDVNLTDGDIDKAVEDVMSVITAVREIYA